MLNKADKADGYRPTKGDRGLQHQLRIVDALRSSPSRADDEPNTPSISSASELSSPTEDSGALLPPGSLPTDGGNRDSPTPISQPKIEQSAHDTADSDSNPQE
jgi:hypothetical protein